MRAPRLLPSLPPFDKDAYHDSGEVGVTKEIVSFLL